MQSGVSTVSDWNGLPRQVALRDMIYLIKQDAVQPDFWLDLSKKGDIAACKRKLLKGALPGNT